MHNLVGVIFYDYLYKSLRWNKFLENQVTLVHPDRNIGYMCLEEKWIWNLHKRL